MSKLAARTRLLEQRLQLCELAVRAMDGAAGGFADEALEREMVAHDREKA